MIREEIRNVQEFQMKRILILGAALVGLTSSACVDADASLLLTGPVTFDGAVSEDEEAGTVSASCTISTDRSRAWSRLSINLEEIKTQGQSVARYGIGSIPNSFDMSVVLQNRLQPSDVYSPIGENQNLRVDQNLIQVEKVSFSFPSGSNQPGFNALDKSFDFIVTVDSGGGESAAYVPIISPADIRTWEQVVSQVTGSNPSAVVPGSVEIQVSGRTTSGTEIESNLINVPFDVCLNCSIASTPRCLESN
jgi:hypothetical protein